MVPNILSDKTRNLPIFAYAGSAPVIVPTKTIRLTAQDLDITGQTDSTKIIQSSIDKLAAAGGGTLILPTGNIRVEIPSGKDAALYINSSNIVLRGESSDYEYFTNIICTTNFLRKRCILKIGETNPTFDNAENTYAAPIQITHDIAQNDTTITVKNTDSFRVDDWIIIRSDWTKAFIKEKEMGRYWKPSTINGQMVWRKITAIDDNALSLDIPIGFPIKARDNLRVYKCTPKIQNIVVENLGFVNAFISNHRGLGSFDFSNKGTLAYDLHASYQIKLNDCANCIVKNVHTVKYNGRGAASCGLLLRKSRSITVENCSFIKSTYRGGGGNGYGIVMQSGDCLIKNCDTKSVRHGITFRGGNTNGNVITGYHDTGSSFPVDYHMHLSAANLIECSTIDKNFFEAKNRGAYGSSGIKHGQSSEYCVFWNVSGTGGLNAKLIKTGQRGTGIIVGTSGSRNKVENINKKDYVEMIGKGDTLEPQSIYEYQKNEII